MSLLSGSPEAPGFFSSCASRSKGCKRWPGRRDIKIVGQFQAIFFHVFGTTKINWFDSRENRNTLSYFGTR